MVKKRESKQRTRGKSFIEWCTENGERGERLANEFKDPDKLPTEVCKASTYKALWKCLKCKHAWRAMVCNRTKSDTPTGCPKCAKHASASKIKNFLVWCEKNGERGKKLLKEYVDPDRKPTSVTKASHYKALWKCLKCKNAWRAMVCHRTDSDRPTGCPKCASCAPLSKTKNFLVWCEKNGERGKKLLKEYVDPDRKPTSVTKGSHHKALWTCLKCMHSWRTKVHNRTDSDKPTGCPNCNKRGRKGKRRRDD